MLFIGLLLFTLGMMGFISVCVYNSIYTIPKKQYKRMREHEKAYNERFSDIHRDVFFVLPEVL